MLGRTEPIFIDPYIIYSMKINDSLQRQHLLPAIRSISGPFFTFQQDSVLGLGSPCSHCCRPRRRTSSRRRTARISIRLTTRSGTFCKSESVYRCQICDVDHFKERLIHGRRRFDQSIVDRAVGQWRQRLLNFVREEGEHFEHQI